MNLEKLKVGMEIKNYKEITTLLNEDIKTGKSKICQHKDWNRYFKYHKDGQKYIIEEVYNEPMAKIDKRKEGNNSIYVKYIETILLQLLTQQTKQTLVITKKDLLCKLGMVSKTYIDNHTRGILVDTHKFNKQEIQEFDKRSNQILDRILTSSLNSLENRSLIDCKKVLYIKTCVSKDKYETHMADDDEIGLYNDVKRELTILVNKRLLYPQPEDDSKSICDEYNEYDDISELENELLEKLSDDALLKYDKTQYTYIRNKIGELYSNLQKILKDNYGWVDTFTCYRIIYTKHSVKSALAVTERQFQILQNQNNDDTRKLLNDKIIQALNNHAVNHYNHMCDLFWNKYYEKYEEYGITVSKEENPLYFNLDIVSEMVLPNNNYINNQKALVDKFIKI